MEIFRIRIKPLTGFGSPLHGETLFGQLCWSLRYIHGEDRLEALLKGYLQNKPFAVISDGFPAGYLPLPNFPGFFWDGSEEDPKKLKARSLIALENLNKPIRQWRNLAKSSFELKSAGQGTYEDIQTHNSINRTTGTTGEGEFAPYLMPLKYFGEASRFDFYALLDTSRITAEELQQAVASFGQSGYGRDASVGLGKFEIEEFTPVQFNWRAETFMALSGFSLSGMAIKEPTFYKVRTHFGRHGGLLAQSGNPFKSPVITTLAGAVVTPQQKINEPFIGSGIGGLSKVQASAVQQGYAIVVGLNLADGEQ